MNTITKSFLWVPYIQRASETSVSLLSFNYTHSHKTHAKQPENQDNSTYGIFGED